MCPHTKEEVELYKIEVLERLKNANNIKDYSQIYIEDIDEYNPRREVLSIVFPDGQRLSVSTSHELGPNKEIKLEWWAK